MSLSALVIQDTTTTRLKSVSNRMLFLFPHTLCASINVYVHWIATLVDAEAKLETPLAVQACRIPLFINVA